MEIPCNINNWLHFFFCCCLGAAEEIYSFPTADPYLEEDRAFLEAVVSGDHSKIQSTYEDAFKTYQLTWNVRRASEL